MSGQSRPSYAWYGDDFTGATDTLATLAARGVQAFLFLGVPSREHLEQAGPLDALGVAGSVRSMAPDAMDRELQPVATFFAETGARLIHYKCCSTFDSAAELGNLVTAVETLRVPGARDQVLVLGGQPSLDRYCIFGNLFAAAGQGGDVYRLDRHPTMSRHPATPMSEADLRRHLIALGARDVGLISWRDLEAERDINPGDKPYVLLDALDERHIACIGQLLRARATQGTPQIVLGASSVAQAFFPASETTAPNKASADSGPTLAIAGSLSPLTRRQIAAATRYRRVAVNPERLLSEEAHRQAIIKEAVNFLKQGANVLVTTAPDADAHATSAHADLATATGRLTDSILNQAPVRRLLVAGGDTSSHVVQHLGVWGLSSAGSFAPGVALSKTRSDNPARDGLCLLLKGGQMGEEAMFDRFAEPRQV
ncbi:four-carbon acid sugar kinase family protein [Tianweitania populi]|uniref:Hrp-dependent type III effector protein n=1 Tax=Tianweitania populi TaxID=1607949 RepID=A0A8J3DSI4_9HYPH|nr:four-carbon acid sugar kinase family protein [Tianweitania populi]GHD22020.1 Hrp-dependent type III effector protein [Tianweitania populi]